MSSDKNADFEVDSQGNVRDVRRAAGEGSHSPEITPMPATESGFRSSALWPLVLLCLTPLAIWLGTTVRIPPYSSPQSFPKFTDANAPVPIEAQQRFLEEIQRNMGRDQTESSPFVNRITTIQLPPKPATLGEQMKQLRHALELLGGELSKLEQELEKMETHFKVMTNQVAMREQLGQPASPQLVSQMKSLRSVLDEGWQQAREIRNSKIEAINLLITEGDKRVAAGLDRKLDIPRALEQWLNAFSLSHPEKGHAPPDDNGP